MCNPITLIIQNRNYRKFTYPRLLKNLTKHFPKNCITFSTDSPLNSANAAAKLVISSSGYVCRVLKTICLQSALSSSCSHISSPYSNCNENFIVPLSVSSFSWRNFLISCLSLLSILFKITVFFFSKGCITFV